MANALPAFKTTKTIEHRWVSGCPCCDKDQIVVHITETEEVGGLRQIVAVRVEHKVEPHGL